MTPTPEELQYGGADEKLLKNFMKEFFPFAPLKKAGFFTAEIKGNYYAQARRVCRRLGLKTIYEYGSEEIKCHISYAGERPKNDSEFITTIPNIYES